MSCALPRCPQALSHRSSSFHHLPRCRPPVSRDNTVSRETAGSSVIFPPTCAPSFFSEVDGAKVWCERPLLCHSRGLRVPHGRSPLHGLAFAREGTSCRVRCSRFCRLRRGGRAKKSPASHRG